MDQSPIYVTRPSLPPLAEVLPLLEEIWQRRMLSNNGPVHQRFEAELARHLGVEHVSVVANATLGLILALRQIGASGEVITTPFSFVATAHAVRWAGAEPVFADIDQVTLNLDPEAVERQITPRTSAILAVHCYGVPCDVARLEAIAARHAIPVIYDAAHAFGVKLGNKSLLCHGDLSVLSFHATKVFHSCEGGAVVCRDRETKLAIDRLRDFGIVDEVSVPTLGLNAKMSEVHAAVGLANLGYVDETIEARGAVARRYWDGLRKVDGIRCACDPDTLGHNYYAFPILVSPQYGLSRDALAEKLREHGVFARRYFYPLISEHPMYSDLPSAAPEVLPVAHQAASRVLCLPMYPDLESDAQARIIDVIRRG